MSSSKKHIDPRKTALNQLIRIDQGRDTLDRIVDDITHKAHGLSRKDRSLLNMLLYGVTRHKGRLDWIIDHFSTTPLSRIESKVMNVLRLGLFQIVFMERIPVSAAVNTSVELAKSITSPWVVKFVNGLLRNAVREYHTVPYPSMTDAPAAALAVLHSFPEWLVEKWLDRFGIEDTTALCEAMNHIPPITLRTNTLKMTRSELTDSIRPCVDTIQETGWVIDGLEISGLHMPISEMAAFREGGFQVQDQGAQLITHLLDPQPGETVLDACAGLGGKTGHIAQLMKNTGKILALDDKPEKLRRLDTDMKRLGLSTVTPVCMDLNRPDQTLPESPFDRILLDAPCTGLGVLRRNPDAKWRVRKEDPATHAQRQKRFLKQVARFMKPSGTMVYAVCSFEPEETDQVVKDFLNNHPEFVMETRSTRLPADVADLVDRDGFFRTFPHLHPMDGFFAARLKLKS